MMSTRNKEQSSDGTGLPKIIHIDMDAFYASVEQRDDETLRGKPIAVGYDGGRSVLTTASYEARRFGVRSAMPVMRAKELCPQLIIVPIHFEKYREISHQVREIFRDYTDIIEPLSLDEAYLDVTVNKKNMPLAVDIAKEIRQRIKDELHLTASAGVSYNKFLAKIASDFRKPDGLTVIHPDRADEFIARLPIEDFWGVGRKTASVMHRMGIFTGGQLREYSLQRLTQVFGKMGTVYYEFARGIDRRRVEPDSVRKSVGCERTFMKDLNVKTTLLIELYHLVLELVERIEKDGFKGRTLTLKVKFHDFNQLTRSTTRNKDLLTKADILPLAKALFANIDFADHPIRLLGLSVSNPHADDEGMHAEWVEQYLPFKEY